MRAILHSVMIVTSLLTAIESKAITVDVQLGNINNNGNFVQFPNQIEIVAPGVFNVAVGLAAEQLNPQGAPVPTNIIGVQYNIAYTNELNPNFFFGVAAGFVNVQNLGFQCFNAILATAPAIVENGIECQVTVPFLLNNPFAQATRINQFFPLFSLNLLAGNNAKKDGIADVFIVNGKKFVFIPLPPPPAPPAMNDLLLVSENPQSSNFGIDLVPVPAPVPFLGVYPFFVYSRKIRRSFQNLVSLSKT